MTLTPRILPHDAAGILAGRRIAVRWSAVSAATRATTSSGSRGSGREHRTLVIELELRSGGEGHMEARLESDVGVEPIAARQRVACATLFDGSLLHVDVEQDGRRLLALSLDPSSPDGGPLYARSCLFAEIGALPGTFGPPVVRLVAPAHAAARPA